MTLTGYSPSSDIGSSLTSHYCKFNFGLSQSETNLTSESYTVLAVPAVERYQYDPYGKRKVMNAGYGEMVESGIGQEFGYTGRRHDSEGTDLQYFRARYYSSSLGRFISRDPLGTALDVNWMTMLGQLIAGSGYKDGMSLYRAYFSVNGVDPNGLGLPAGVWVVLWIVTAGSPESYGGCSPLGEVSNLYAPFPTDETKWVLYGQADNDTNPCETCTWYAKVRKMKQSKKKCVGFWIHWFPVYFWSNPFDYKKENCHPK